jgi:hypothetical protein
MTPINFLPVEFSILQGVSKLMKNARRRTTSLSSKKTPGFSRQRDKKRRFPANTPILTT